MGGLWEFPGGKVESNETLEDALHREIKEEVNLDIKINGFLCKVDHAYSHFKITMHAFICETNDASLLCCKSADDYTWIKAKQLDEFAFPKANCVVISHLK